MLAVFAYKSFKKWRNPEDYPDDEEITKPYTSEYSIDYASKEMFVKKQIDSIVKPAISLESNYNKFNKFYLILQSSNNLWSSLIFTIKNANPPQIFKLFP